MNNQIPLLSRYTDLPIPIPLSAVAGILRECYLDNVKLGVKSASDLTQRHSILPSFRFSVNKNLLFQHQSTLMARIIFPSKVGIAHLSSFYEVLPQNTERDLGRH